MISLQKLSLVLVSSLLAFGRGADDEDTRVPVIGVSIEDFIDLDAPPSSGSKDGSVLTSQPGPVKGREISVGHGDVRIAPGLGPAPPPLQVLKGDIIKPPVRRTPMTSDDEDAELSADGSGSGDDQQMADDALFTNSNMTTTLPPSDQVPKVNVTMDTPLEVVTGAGDTVTDPVDTVMTSDANVTISDVVYTADVWPPVPVLEQTDEGEDIRRWSPWIRTNDVTEVRVRTCTGNVDWCNGTEAQLRQCDRESNRCEVSGAVVTSENVSANDQGPCSRNKSEEEEDATPVIQPMQKAIPLPPGEIDLLRTELQPCTYSLFDLKRSKYLITEWSLTRLVTQAKVKKWCSKPHDYLVFHSPHQHCRRYYKDLCHVSKRCKGSHGSPKARGDFAEGCWRQFVYGGQLPVGLSNRQTIVYLICQRYAANSALGKAFGHKKSHFATLYDTKGRAPVVSLMKLTELGDTAWPDTQYFIEHGLVEDAEDTAWFLRKAKKGIVQLADMGKCQNDDSCQLGAHQVLPSDYSSTTYRTAHLMWPDLVGPDPLSRAATFTLTNTAPMHAALYPAWHRAVLRVRHFGLHHCGLPNVSPADFVFSAHHGHKHQTHHHYYGHGDVLQHTAALYIASGVIPSRDPMETIGNDVNVPFMFWMAACCITANTTKKSSDNHYHQNDYAMLFDDVSENQGQRHISFAIYARNTGTASAGDNAAESQEPREQVVAAPVLQLEMLLQDIYKILPTDADVNLFPASGGACSELRNDFSRDVRL